ncbi:hypothetical protein GLOTRDRAFT_134881 [Gloeophyllum trabeum ATCC 11539]|uniref:SMP-LTD domain-containing protein n=1 Tax=Gloeophyllum trabeum (strain ATCC 11539 / FP-39264 / Madison 617) TaxID=670483 RepID=S7RYV2_GLOTA|nr:uncharacterized protein GLOTRDRAFT_134881 [Gloeophyllum trabeum ATCC 11539]EPQ60135.1 hypothetical protein GLOTRDRAFT_134881 [Gloeophyllum trabeum ATCC 11539]
MSFKALVYAYVLGGITFIPLVILGLIFITIYTSVPVGDPDVDKNTRAELERKEDGEVESEHAQAGVSDLNDTPRTRKGWLTIRRTFEESNFDGSYVQLVRSYLDSRSKDPKRSRPKDMWYVVLKGKVLYLYEDETMTECEAAIELSGHDVVIYPEGLADGELFAKRNAICLKPKAPPPFKAMPSLTKEMMLGEEDLEEKIEEVKGGEKKKEREKAKLEEVERQREMARQQALDSSTPWFIFVRSNVDMEDWYFALVHASEHTANSPTLEPLKPVFKPEDMAHLVSTLDEQPDVIPMRWLNALIGRIFFSYYRTKTLEAYIIGRLMKKLSKVKRPSFLSDVVVKEVSVGNRAPTFSKPMLKELTKEGDAALEVKVHYKGEVRITAEATATINLGARFKTYQVKLVLAAVLRELDGNLLIKVKRPPSNRIWYAFTQMPHMVLDVEPIVSDRQITWGMILSTIEARLKEIIQESVVMPNMDDIAFFESSSYQHRGGIWADASRHEEQESEQVSAPEDEDAASTASMPPPDVPTTDVDRDSAIKQRSHSTSEVPAEAGPSESSVVFEADPFPDEKTPTSSSSVLQQRRASSASQQVESHSIHSEPQTDTEETEEQRGRRPEMDNSVPARPRSAPAENDQARPGSDFDGSSGLNRYLSAQSSRRSASQHSQASSHRSSSSSSHQHDNDPGEGSDGTPAPSAPQQKAVRTGTGLSISSSPTTSFFSTLKSRAGDKQALSNTAKEAMRKWGVNVNWGALRRDGGGITSTDEGGMDDSGRAESSRSNHKPKFSYADMRAAVAERRERGRASPDVAGSSFQASSSSNPIAIPGSQQATEFDTSRSPTGSQPGVSPSENQANSSPPDKSERPRFISPSASRTTTAVQAPGQQPAADLDAVRPEEEPESPPSPIHTQPPQAPTMTIPGIHASHRGEVMSMGYVPPSPPLPSLDSKGRSPAISSVYRLLKSPILSPAQQQQGQGSETPRNDAGGQQRSNTPADEARPTPPPLPPRSTSTPVAKGADAHVSGGGGVLSPASAALKSIATKDESKRLSADSEGAGGMSGNASPDIEGGPGEGTSPAVEPQRRSKPPLPPRRSQPASVQA